MKDFNFDKLYFLCDRYHCTRIGQYCSVKLLAIQFYGNIPPSARGAPVWPGALRRVQVKSPGQTPQIMCPLPQSKAPSSNATSSQKPPRSNAPSTCHRCPAKCPPVNCPLVRCPYLLINRVKSPLGQTPPTLHVPSSQTPPSGQTPTPVSDRDGVCYVIDGTWYNTDIGNKT